MASTRYSVMLYRFLVGDDGDGLPFAVLQDPLVQYMKYSIENFRCPFCGRKFGIRAGIINHLVRGNHRCKAMFEQFIQLTISRYYLFSGNTRYMSSALRKIRKKQAKVIK